MTVIESQGRMHVGLLAPVTPSAIASFLYDDARRTAEKMDDNYGTAPSAIAASLLRAGHRVSIVTHRRGRGALELEGPRCRFIQVESLRTGARQALDWWLPERKAMATAMRKCAPDVVHAHWTYEWASAALSLDLPTVITVRDAPWTILTYMPDAYRLSRALLATRVSLQARRRNAVLTAVSPYMARRWKREMRWSSDPVVVPNPSPIDVGVHVESRRSPTPEIIEIADAGSRKNVKRLLEAFRIVRKQQPSARLILIGGGLDEGGELWHWAERHQLVGGVEFRGVRPRQEVVSSIRHAWVHAHVALEESFGNTLVEAMQLGTSVLGGSKSGAVPWVLDGGKSGELVNVKDPQEIAQGILRLLESPRIRDQLEDNGRARATTYFSSEAVAAAYVDLYEAAADV